VVRDATAISIADEGSLSWFFGPGQTIYERSTFGAILDKLKLASADSETCARCDGAGILDVGGFATDKRCKTCDGTGKGAKGRGFCVDCKGFGCVDAYQKPANHGGWCPACRGAGVTPIETAARRRTRCFVCKGVKGSSACRGCSNCLGTGEEPINAKPIHGGHEGGGVSADDSALTRFASISRVIEGVRAVSPRLSAALEAMYGDRGQRWAATDQGRMYALHDLTPAGKRLARCSGALSADDRASLLVEAADQARKLLARAARAWNDKAHAKRERVILDRLGGSLGRLGYSELGKAMQDSARGLR
jgi:hypothetical protein